AKRTAKAQSIPRGKTDSRADGNILVVSIGTHAVQANHFVIEVSDGNAGGAGILKVSRVHAHAGAGLSLRAEGNAGLDGDLLERAVPRVPVELVGLGVIGD